MNNFEEIENNEVKTLDEEQMTQLKSKIEAVLFVTAKAMKIKEIAEILNQDEMNVESALLDLMFDYSSREGALEIDDEDGYILQVRQEHLDIVEKLCPVELKPATLKTLTVIALKEPIRQSYLKELRGANAYEHVAEPPCDIMPSCHGQSVSYQVGSNTNN